MTEGYRVEPRPTGPWGSTDWYVVHSSGREWGAFTHRRDARSFVRNVRQIDAPRVAQDDPAIRCKVCGSWGETRYACVMTYCDPETPQECAERMIAWKRTQIVFGIWGVMLVAGLVFLSYAG